MDRVLLIPFDSFIFPLYRHIHRTASMHQLQIIQSRLDQHMAFFFLDGPLLSTLLA